MFTSVEKFIDTWKQEKQWTHNVLAGLTAATIADAYDATANSLTVLMRQAGLRVPSFYGPTREDWAQWGMPVPTI